MLTMALSSWTYHLTTGVVDMGKLVDLSSYFYWRKQARKYEELSKKVIPFGLQIEWSQEAVKCEERAERCLHSVLTCDKLMENDSA